MRATEVRSAMTGLIEQARRASSVVAVKSQVELCELVKYCNGESPYPRASIGAGTEGRSPIPVRYWTEDQDNGLWSGRRKRRASS
mmetsp:Transcript_4988/g.21562  ORF Transcript_4988/g.21562 Transcript_4988/m.21562 type:complete len:85 (+) Transcript_4988:240-494(+)